jgi:hypothetical protein
MIRQDASPVVVLAAAEPDVLICCGRPTKCKRFLKKIGT